MRIGVLIEGEPERYFVKKELERAGCQVEFIHTGSLDEARKALNNGLLDAAVVSSDAGEQFDRFECVDWFSFSWYDDYPYNVEYTVSGRASETPVAPLYLSDDITARTYRRTQIPVHRMVALTRSGQISGFLLPGRVDYYLHKETPGIFNGLQKRYLKVRGVKRKEFSVLYMRNNRAVLELLPRFLKCVTFVGAGVGDPGLCSQAGIEALKQAEVCLYDCLMSQRLLNYLPEDAILVNVGKRHRRHSVEQPQINHLIVKYARSGYRVVRLKSGDPSIFGRLAEEISYLDKNHIPYRVVPGISSMSAMAMNAGIVLTRRGVNRGFCVMSPIRHGGSFASVGLAERKKLPMVFFMGVRVVDKIARQLMEEGLSADTKASVVFSIGSDEEFVARGTLQTIGECIKPYIESRNGAPPGLFVVGDIAGYAFKDFSLLKRKRVLVATSEEDRSRRIVARLKDLGATVCIYKGPQIKDCLIGEIMSSIEAFDTLAFSQVSVFRSFVGGMGNTGALDRMPLIVVSSSVYSQLNPFEKRAVAGIECATGRTLYIYTRRDQLFASRLAERASLEERMLSRKPYMGRIGKFESAIFLDEDSLFDFVETHGIEMLGSSDLFVPDSQQIKEFLSKKSIEFHLLPEGLGSIHTDLMQLFEALKGWNRKKLIAM